jgi:hypothetical protein
MEEITPTPTSFEMSMGPGIFLRERNVTKLYFHRGKKERNIGFTLHWLALAILNP